MKNKELQEELMKYPDDWDIEIETEEWTKDLDSVRHDQYENYDTIVLR